jgi:rod shape-determining protein MreD
MSKIILPDIIDLAHPHFKKRFLSVAVLLLFVLSEATILTRLRIFNINPDIILVAVVITALNSSLGWTLFFGYFAGVLSDIFGVYSYGINTLLFTLLGLFAYELSKEFMIESEWRLVAVVALAVFLRNVATAVFLALSGNSFPLGVFFLSSVIGSAYSAAVSPLILKLFKYISQ